MDAAAQTKPDMASARRSIDNQAPRRAVHPSNLSASPSLVHSLHHKISIGTSNSSSSSGTSNVSRAEHLLLASPSFDSHPSRPASKQHAPQHHQPYHHHHHHHQHGRDRSMPIYVRIVPKDVWLRFHVLPNQTVGSIKDAALLHARAPLYDPALSPRFYQDAIAASANAKLAPVASQAQMNRHRNYSLPKSFISPVPTSNPTSDAVLPSLLLRSTRAASHTSSSLSAPSSTKAHLASLASHLSPSKTLGSIMNQSDRRHHARSTVAQPPPQPEQTASIPISTSASALPSVQPSTSATFASAAMTPSSSYHGTHDSTTDTSASIQSPHGHAMRSSSSARSASGDDVFNGSVQRQPSTSTSATSATSATSPAPSDIDSDPPVEFAINLDASLITGNRDAKEEEERARARLFGWMQSSAALGSRTSTSFSMTTRPAALALPTDSSQIFPLPTAATPTLNPTEPSLQPTSQPTNTPGAAFANSSVPRRSTSPNSTPTIGYSSSFVAFSSPGNRVEAADATTSSRSYQRYHHTDAAHADTDSEARQVLLPLPSSASESLYLGQMSSSQSLNSLSDDISSVNSSEEELIASVAADRRRAADLAYASQSVHLTSHSPMSLSSRAGQTPLAPLSTSPPSALQSGIGSVDSASSSPNRLRSRTVTAADAGRRGTLTAAQSHSIDHAARPRLIPETSQKRGVPAGLLELLNESESPRRPPRSAARPKAPLVSANNTRKTSGTTAAMTIDLASSSILKPLVSPAPSSNDLASSAPATSTSFADAGSPRSILSSSSKANDAPVAAASERCGCTTTANTTAAFDDARLWSDPTRLAGIALDEISQWKDASHDLSGRFSVLSFSNGCVLEEWKTVASYKLRPYELLEMQWSIPTERVYIARNVTGMVRDSVEAGLCEPSPHSPLLEPYWEGWIYMLVGSVKGSAAHHHHLGIGGGGGGGGSGGGGGGGSGAGGLLGRVGGSSGSGSGGSQLVKWKLRWITVKGWRMDVYRKKPRAGEISLPASDSVFPLLALQSVAVNRCSMPVDAALPALETLHPESLTLGFATRPTRTQARSNTGIEQTQLTPSSAVVTLRCITEFDHDSLQKILRRARLRVVARSADLDAAAAIGALANTSTLALNTKTEMSRSNSAQSHLSSHSPSRGQMQGSGAEGSELDLWRRKALFRALVAGRGGTVAPGLVARSSSQPASTGSMGISAPATGRKRNANARSRLCPAGWPRQWEDADAWSSDSEIETV
ncbi:hypothetical protein BCV70DRAFT_126597 [Testicularia cyperi]|uniref:Uncharacterized protein n=1 Tax=Testicularia cyperi TaxID=1882483 RepID=A0A317XLL9_9BASI|nr:hypothetical protein BCV70DRAFT_126597 [Testicularia cyperi]